jgi:hypothetical protein
MPYKEIQTIDPETQQTVVKRVTSGYELKRFWGVHRQIILLHASGRYTNIEIAGLLDISSQTVSNVLGLDESQAELQRLYQRSEQKFEDVQERIQALAPEALDEIEDLLRTPTTAPSLKFKIAKDILEKANHTPVQKSISVNSTVTSETLAAIKKRAEELKAASVAQEINYIEQQG